MRGNEVLNEESREALGELERPAPSDSFSGLSWFTRTLMACGFMQHGGSMIYQESSLLDCARAQLRLRGAHEQRTR